MKSASCCQGFVASVLFCPVSTIINVDEARSKAAGLWQLCSPAPRDLLGWDICPQRCRENSLQMPAALDRTSMHPGMHSCREFRALLQWSCAHLSLLRNQPTAKPGQ